MVTQNLTDRIGRTRLDALVDAYAAKRIDAEDLYKAMIDDLAAHLTDLQTIGVVRPFDALPNRRMNLSHSWNVMCGTAEHPYSSRENETSHVAHRFGHSLIGAPLRMLAFDVERGMDAEKRETAMAKAMGGMDSGNVGWWMTGQEQDFVTGENLSYELRDWNPVFGHQPKRGGDLVSVADVAPVKLHEMEMDLPTGELLIADWFRPDGFTDLVDEGNPWRGGSERENEADAERYLRDHGFTSVCSARRSLTVFRKGDRITMGHHDEDGDHPKPKGYRRIRDLTIDLRKVSIVDRSSLLATLNRIHPPERAEELVREIVEERDTVKLKVPPGRYRIVSSGRGYIDDLLPDGDPLKVEGYEPVLVIERI